jgi:hypothetical protein
MADANKGDWNDRIVTHAAHAGNHPALAGMSGLAQGVAPQVTPWRYVRDVQQKQEEGLSIMRCPEYQQAHQRLKITVTMVEMQGVPVNCRPRLHRQHQQAEDEVSNLENQPCGRWKKARW